MCSHEQQVAGTPVGGLGGVNERWKLERLASSWESWTVGESWRDMEAGWAMEGAWLLIGAWLAWLLIFWK